MEKTVLNEAEKALKIGGADRGHLTRYDVNNVVERLKQIHGQRFIEYREKWEASTKCEIVPEFPLMVEIGVNSDCNLQCKMCARNFDKGMNNKHINMPLELIDKIVEQGKAFSLPAVLVGQDSECLLHPEIKKIVRRIKEMDPLDLFFITNGTLLDKDMSRFLVEAEVDRLQISVDAATEETYKKIRGGSLARLEQNIYDFLEIRDAMGKDRPFLRLSFCKQEDNIAEEKEFIDKWHNVADMVDFQEYLDLSHVLEPIEQEYREYHCPDPFQRVVIDYMGNMYGCCCVGYNRYFCLGNLKDVSILEAWNSPKMNTLRESFRKQELNKVCLNCRANRGIHGA